ncbi:Cof-type HAD-IIB family hydrolase [Enterococcus saccharolyticus]|uniref:Cof-type HAD-IIB family hydrolase n=1 Tax=Enterococcus saccharolyticus TaxID=41997 RepID=UPI0039E01A5A
MIKLITSDMDGTLLDAEMRISQENIEAIQYAQSKGIEFMVATGRNRFEALPALEEAGVDCAMITLNGAQVFDQEGNEVFSAPIDLQTTQAVLDILDEHQIYYEVSTNKGTYSESKEQRIENFAAHIAETMPHLTHKMAIAMTVARLEFLPIHFIDNIRELIMQEDITVLKIICFHKEGALYLGPAAKKINVYDELIITSSSENNIEINHRAAQKGIAVGHVALNRNIDMQDVMTIGDNLNDVSMIQAAGVSFAMGNALPELKEYAKYVTETNVQSGVGKAIVRAIDEEL